MEALVAVVVVEDVVLMTPARDVERSLQRLSMRLPTSEERHPHPSLVWLVVCIARCLKCLNQKNRMTKTAAS